MLPRRNILLVAKRALVLLFILCLIGGLIMALQSITSLQPMHRNLPSRKDKVPIQSSSILPMTQNHNLTGVPNSVAHNVHIFYYPWYGNVETDKEWSHWNHEYLPNWDKQDKNVYPTGRHIPPDDIGANFYPSLGCYSSRDPLVIDQHMKWIRDAGVGVLVVSWYPPDEADREGKPFDSLFPVLLDKAQEYGLKIAFHIEPYKDRNPVNLRSNIEYIVSRYGKHPALYRLAKSIYNPPLPVYYVYDSYLNTAKSWNSLLGPSGSNSIRNTELDGVFLGLLVELRHKQDIVDGGFDGFYTYFAARDFTYGSSWKNWKTLSNFARKHRLFFVPSVGPGYIDTRVRPWNGRNTKHRKNGKYYTQSWRSAILARTSVVSITSFNEWHEGTQIEPAQPKSFGNYTYEDYSPNDPDFYLTLTKQLVNEFKGN